MRSFLRDDVPWGRRAVPAIPVPPFTRVEDHLSYLRWLQLHIAMTDTEAPSLASVVLNEALQDEAAEVRAGGHPHRQPGRLTLQVSWATFFPAPWTPELLAPVLDPLDRHSPHQHRSGWRWGSDPIFTAETHPGGGWTITRSERGQLEEGVLSGTGDLVLLWMDHYRDRFPYPMANRRSADDLSALAPSARATRRAFAVDQQMPYLTSWVAERDQALDDAPTVVPDVDEDAPRPERWRPWGRRG